MKSDKLKKEILESLSKDFGTIDKAVLDMLFQFIDQLDSAGGQFNNKILSVEKIAELQRLITDTLVKDGYLAKVDTFIRDLNKITFNSLSTLEGNGYGVQKMPLNEIEKKWQSFTVDSLTKSGLNEKFINPVTQIIDSSISFGRSISEVKKELEDYILDGKDTTGKLKSYTTTTARDVISTMQGAQINGVAIEQGYDYLQYTGGLLDDSRGQCYHWVREMNGKIPKEKLVEEIRLAYKNQREKKVIFANGEEYKYGGMMPDTTIDNFIIKRGGWGCLHSAFPRKNRK